MNICFFGSNNISLSFLKELIKKENDVIVITQPDKPSNRGLVIKPNIVKNFCLKNNLPFITPENLLDKEFIHQILNFNPSLGIVVCYGKILPQELFSIPKYGCVNLHFSLLPRYRGPAPIQWTLINGETKTGVTAFFIDSGIDTGNIILQKEINIDLKDDFFSLEKKLINIGIDCMFETIQEIKENRIKTKIINIDKSLPYARSLKKIDGKIDWTKSAQDIYNLIRAIKLWPKAFTTYKKDNEYKTIKILDAEPVYKTFNQNNQCGEIIDIEKNNGFTVKCGQNFLFIKQVHPENRNIMGAWDFLLGARLKSGDRFV